MQTAESKTNHPICIVKRNGRSYYACPDCGRKFVHLHKVDDHNCKYRPQSKPIA